MRQARWRSRLITGTFLVMIALPLLNGWLGFIPDVDSGENRALAPRPNLDSVGLDSFPYFYEDYYKDHFSFRFRLARAYSRLKIGLFHTSPYPHRGLLGKDGWLFMADNEHNSYLGKSPFSPEELDRFARELDYRTDYVAKQGGKFYFVIAPSKNNIYADKMPDSEHPLVDESWGEQLLSHLKAHSRVQTIDLYPVLRKGHAVAMTYQKLDNHWTGRGAFMVTNAILARIHEDFPAVQPQPATDYDITQAVTFKGNIAQMLDAKGMLTDSLVVYAAKGGPKAHAVPRVPYPIHPKFPYPESYEIATETCDTTKPKALLIMDSFGIAVYPFLQESFQRTVKIWDNWEYKANEPIVDHEQADVVILMVLEGNLRNMLPHLSTERHP